MKEKYKYIDILLIFSLLVIVVSLFKTETFADTSGNRVPDTSGNRVPDTSGNRVPDTSGNRVPGTSGNSAPAWKPPKPDSEYFIYTIIYIALTVISIVSLALFVYSYAKNEPSFLYATIGLSSIVIFLLIYLSKN